MKKQYETAVPPRYETRQNGKKGKDDERKTKSR